MNPTESVERVPTIAGLVPITEIMSRNPVTARPDTPIDALIDLLRRNGCVPIVDDLNRPTGIVTKLDMIECQAERRRTAREVMMPLAMTLDPQATVAQAAAMMSIESFHHVLIVDEDRMLVGVVSTLDVVHWLARNDGFVEKAAATS